MLEAIRIKSQSSMNLDCGLNLSNLWLPLLHQLANSCTAENNEHLHSITSLYHFLHLHSHSYKHLISHFSFYNLLHLHERLQTCNILVHPETNVKSQLCLNHFWNTSGSTIVATLCSLQLLNISIKCITLGMYSTKLGYVTLRI